MGQKRFSINKSKYLLKSSRKNNVLEDYMPCFVMRIDKKTLTRQKKERQDWVFFGGR